MRPLALFAFVLVFGVGCSSGGGAGGTDDGGPAGASSGSSGNGGGGQNVPWSPGATAAGPAPAITPTLAVVTYVGGAGNQFVRTVSIGDDGSVTATGKGFQVTYAPGLTEAKVEGDLATADGDAYSEKPTLFKEWNTTWTTKKNAKRLDDPRTGLSHYIGTKQVSNDLQQPIFVTCATGADCDVAENRKARLWDWWASVAKDKQLTADSRGYDLFLLPDNLIGIQSWTDGGNSTLARWPLREDPACKDAASCPQLDQNLGDGIAKGTWQEGPNSMSTMYMVFDGAAGKPVAATFLRGHVTNRAVDAWGRIYLPQAIGKVFPTRDPDNLFGHSATASTGLFVLSRDLKTSEVNTRLGGTCSGDGKQQVFGAIAQKGNLLVLGGTTCATDLVVTPSAVQKTSGGGQDGMLVIVKLWD
jgi:hypothetical protein